jgi:hypothetical protein
MTHEASNALVEAYDRSETRKRNRARELLSTLWESRQGCLSIQVLQEIYATFAAKVPHVFPTRLWVDGPIFRVLRPDPRPARPVARTIHDHVTERH